jgi:hypothetical protein
MLQAVSIPAGRSYTLFGVRCVPEYLPGEQKSGSANSASGSVSDHRSHGSVVWERGWELESLHSFDGVCHLGLSVSAASERAFTTPHKVAVGPECNGAVDAEGRSAHCYCACECTECQTARLFRQCDGVRQKINSPRKEEVYRENDS